MKKKIVGILVCMLLIVTAFSTTVNSEDNNIDNQVFNETNTYDNCGCSGNYKINNRNWIIKKSEIPLNPDETLEKPIVMDNLPDYFNWMDYEGKDWTTSAKDQSSCGSCWIFAALGALDSIINIREGIAELDVDLSEQYAISCLPRAGNCITGWAYKAFFYIMSDRPTGNNCNGIIPESCFPYKAIDAEGINDYSDDNDPVLCDEKCENWEDFLIPISDFGKWYPDGSIEDIDAIKTQVMQNGPVCANIDFTFYIHGKDSLLDWGWDHNDIDEFYTTSEDFVTSLHCIVIVGWRDDTDITNGGYWICKNSWGPEWGYNGFFNIEYGKLRIDSIKIAWVDYEQDVFVNWKPIAKTGGIYYGDIGQEIMFDASDSFDHEGEIISYEWDFGDGNHESGIDVAHSYESQGAYPIELTVIDNVGNICNDTTWAFIGRSNNPPNTPIINGPSNGKKGIEYSYNFSAVDPEGDDIYYYIYWGDMYVPVWIGPFPSGEEITLNHTYIDKTTFILRVKARDCYDFKSDWSILEVTIPKNKMFEYDLDYLRWLIERFPNAFPILKHLTILKSDLNVEHSIFWR